MRISLVNYATKVSLPNIYQSFRSNNNKNQSDIDNNDNDKYVKVPKIQRDLENWIFGILTGVTVLEFIYLLANKKK